MLHLRDAATGQVVRLPGHASRPLRILLAPDQHDYPAVLRAALVGDLVRRVAEMQQMQAAVATPGEPLDLIAYNVHPAGSVDPTERPDIVVGRVERDHVSLVVGSVAGGIPMELIRLRSG